MGISYFKRIKRPNDQANPPPQCFLALIEFQRPPNSTVAIIPVHTCHVRMKKHSPVNKSHERQRVSDQPFRVERSKNLPARFLRHHEQRCRLDFEVLFAPNLSLQRSAEILQYPHIFERRSPRSSDFASLHRLSRITFFGTLRRLPKFLHLLARNIRQCLSALQSQILHPPESCKELRVSFLQRDFRIDLQKTSEIHRRKE